MKRTYRKFVTVFAVGWVVVWAGPARANLTTLYPPPAGEQSVSQILSHVYGGTFAGTAAQYSNGTITTTRIDDTLANGGIGNNLNLVFGTPNPLTTDQRWIDGIAITSAEARFAGYSQQFGYNDGGGYTNLFNVSMNGPSGYDVVGSNSHQFSQGVSWDWARSGQGGTYYSENSRNSDGRDHMLTYQVTGLPGLGANQAVWMLFWEDLPGSYNSGRSDRDFNDLAVEVRATVAAAVPIPGAALLSCVGLGIATLMRRRRGAAD